MSAETTTTTKCPCCDNPWSRALGADLLAAMCVECQEVETTTSGGLSRENMDPTVDPKEDFYHYANGGWIQKNPIPAGYPSWNTVLSLHVKSQENCKALLEELMVKDEKDENGRKLAAFYTAAMNEKVIEELGIREPLRRIMDDIDVIVKARRENNNDAFAKLLGQFAASYGVYPFFSTSPSPDAKNSSHTLCHLSQGGIGLPDRDYYFAEDKDEIRGQYKKHVAKMMSLLDETEASNGDRHEKMAEQIYELERSLAEAHMTRTENRDPHATYNTSKITEGTLDASFDFASYLQGSTGKTADELGDMVNVRNVEALRKAAQVAAAVEPETLQLYLQWKIIHSCAPYLTNAVVEENFDFYERTLSGTQEMKPRWKRVMALTEAALGEALGQLYCARYFDEECKVRALKIVESVRQALEARLKEVDWMKSSSTREAALKKMSQFKVKIGYPNKWIDYSTLDINENQTFLEMVLKSRAFDHRREAQEMNAPTDREKWFMTPQTVNAYYHPSLNEIAFPAAILQHPFFDKTADDSVNFGAMGAVVGHEMTHAFDDKGRKFNYEGILQDWWTEEDATEYESRVRVMVEQANKFDVYGKAVQGELTSGENIADLGGLRLALKALETQSSCENAQEIDGFSPRQRFFLSWAQCWRQNITKERSLQLVTLDPHGPNELRCNGPLSNMPEFHEAFQVQEGSPMYKEKDARVDIW